MNNYKDIEACGNPYRVFFVNGSPSVYLGRDNRKRKIFREDGSFSGKLANMIYIISMRRKG